MKVIDLIQKGRDLFKRTETEEFELNAEILLAHLLGLEQPETVLLELDREVPQVIHDRFISLVKRRLKSEPTPYIIGHRHFWKQVYKVNKDVLIPRSETELIIEVALKKLQHRESEKLHILDLGTGSGCIILSLLSEFKNFCGVAVDISDRALRIAKMNADNLQLSHRIKFIQSNWFSALKQKQKFDLIVSNPPYIAIGESSDICINMFKKMKIFEPCIAFIDSRDGLKSYKIIAEHSREFLKKDGVMILEINYKRKALIKNIFEDQGYTVEFYKDLKDIYRIAFLKR